jgi:glycosyltransferase involved in cell wall biosynthesis
MYHRTVQFTPATRFTSTSVGSERDVAGVGIARPHRILHCLRAPVGGLFRHVCDLSAEQARQGHLVGIVCDAGPAGPLTEARLTALRPSLALGIMRTRMSRELGPSDLSAYAAIRRHAFSLGIDVIHGHGAKGGAYSRLVGRTLKRSGWDVVSCYTPHGGSLHYHPRTLVGRIYMQLERQLATCTDAIVFESAYSAARYAAQVGQPPCLSRVVPNGLTPADFGAPETSADAADFLFVGELRRLKGVDVLLRALERVHRVRPVSAIIVGAGPDAAEFRAEASRLGLDGTVSFRDAMPAREAFRMGRALVVPSRAESFPYIVLEAAAAGLPLLATDVGGIPEIVAGTDTALLPPEDDVALAGAMLRVLDDAGQARAAARRLQQAVGRRFTVAAMTAAVLGLYDTLDAQSSAAATGAAAAAKGLQRSA